MACPVKLLSRRNLILGSGAALASYLFHEVNALRVVRYCVPVRNLPAPFHGFTLLHLSDLHQKRFGNNQARLLYLIKQQRYDMVALTGDLLNRFRPEGKAALELIAGLGPKPLFFVNGNNEWSAGQPHHDRFIGHLGDAGVTILNNRGVPLSRNGSRIFIAGVDDSSSGREHLDRARADTMAGTPTILLAHSPVVFPAAARAGVELVLAGHTHGGQIRLPGIGALWAPDLGFFPRWDHGRFQLDRTTLIVNSGLGESILPVRVNIPPEIVLVTLTT
jgi:uncharacterized protein